ncbi:uncharacterized protein VICG_01048 [Vittaforma corneae ATCC 50505]|uniref:Telomerase reverse transcriptase n=1 Tax=Vittaforma corneae (strain ATCC 50505) TaxID=993615 RepID=L2GMK1_VITCO|nr:uncharacterized protein VICG_01048 [Vittaforma corneae ATCC 50505]ELA41864.1 hypothetical protein VICG_01048 [Vittaforma corneae ATCC 50505]
MQKEAGIFHGFERFDEFVMRNIGVEIFAESILIKYPGTVPNLPISNHLSIPEILSISLEQSENGNQLSQGYCKRKKQWNSINTTRNIFRSEQWARIFERIGDEYSLFLLEHTCIIQKIGENMVLLCGDINSIPEKRKEQRYVQREQLFRGRPSSLHISVDEALQAIMNDVEISRDNSSILAEKIKKMVRKYQELPLKAIFKSFIIEKPFDSASQHADDDGKRSSKTNSGASIIEDQINPQTIADFLFLISKKFLRPILSLKSFKTLKGKLVLLLKRNAFETLNSEDLSNRFKMSNFKFFNHCKNLSNSTRIQVLKNLMLFLFNSVFLKIVGYFFYSTTTSSTKLKIYYFTRISWNGRTDKFIREYLKEFECCEKTGNFATLRCIPKEDGFRIITNCSRLTSYGTKNHLKQTKQSTKSKLSIEKLSSRYRDLGEILKDESTASTSKCRKRIAHRIVPNSQAFPRFNSNSINSQISSIVPIIRKIASDANGFSLLCHFDVGKRLFPFLKFRSNRMILVKVDLSKCFDNIPHPSLMSFISNMLRKDEYYFREFGVIRENKLGNKVEIKYLKHSPDVLYPMNMVEAQPEGLNYLRQDGMCILKENRTKVISKTDVLKRSLVLLKAPPFFIKIDTTWAPGEYPRAVRFRPYCAPYTFQS